MYNFTGVGFDAYGKIYVVKDGRYYWVKYFEQSWHAYAFSINQASIEDGNVILTSKCGVSIVFDGVNKILPLSEQWDDGYIGECGKQYLEYFSELENAVIITRDGSCYGNMEGRYAIPRYTNIFISVDPKSCRPLSPVLPLYKFNFDAGVLGFTNFITHNIEHWRINELGLLEVKPFDGEGIQYIELDEGAVVTQINKFALAINDSILMVNTHNHFVLTNDGRDCIERNYNIICTYYGKFKAIHTYASYKLHDHSFIIFNTNVIKQYGGRIFVKDIVKKNGRVTKPAICAN